MPTLKTLDEIFGTNKNSKYAAKNEEGYRKYLSSLSKLELQDECLKQKVNPRDTRDLMTRELVVEFRKHLGSIAAAQVKPKILNANDAVKKIFRDH